MSWDNLEALSQEFNKVLIQSGIALTKEMTERKENRGRNDYQDQLASMAKKHSDLKREILEMSKECLNKKEIPNNFIDLKKLIKKWMLSRDVTDDLLEKLTLQRKNNIITESEYNKKCKLHHDEIDVRMTDVVHLCREIFTDFRKNTIRENKRRQKK